MSSVSSSSARKVSREAGPGSLTPRTRGPRSNNHHGPNNVRPCEDLVEKAQKPCSGQPGNEDDHGHTELHKTTSPEIRNAVIQTILSSWKTVVIMVSLIFGGCCANVSTHPLTQA